MSKKRKTIFRQTWDPSKGDYVREKYDYDKSHEEILQKEKRTKKILSVVFFSFAILIILLILNLLTAV